MERISTTPFGQRPVTAGLLAAAARHAQPAPSAPPVDKWHILRRLAVGRAAFSVSDRDLRVLEGLLSFFPDQMLGGNADTVVFPSNRALSARCHGMAESTLRRHIAALVHAGLILRHDSPNGKRYARRDGPDGAVTRAFGFDLVPLVSRSAEILRAADTAEAEAQRLSALRERVSLRKRDAQKLAAYGAEMRYPGNWDAILDQLLLLSRALRRRLDTKALEELGSEVDALANEVVVLLNEAENMSGNAIISERHPQSSKTDLTDLELYDENREAEKLAPKIRAIEPVSHIGAAQPPDIPLTLVLRALPESRAYATEPVQDWRGLIALGASLRGMIGISPSAWQDAVDAMGPEVAALTICCLTERITEIRSPGGYLRHLTREAIEGRFSVTRLVMAQIHREPAARAS